MMKSFCLLFVLLSLGFSQNLFQGKFNFDGVKSIWQSPDLQPALNLLSLKSEVSVHKALTSRITRGNFASPGQFPHSVVMVIDVEWICGGSILSSRWILTVRFRKNCDQQRLNKKYF